MKANGSGLGKLLLLAALPVGNFVFLLFPCAAMAGDGWLTAQRQQAYAFDQPRLLVQQELFGLAHGISLLADACEYRDQQPLAAADKAVLADWQAKQADFLAQMQHELGRFYFGDLAQNQTWPVLTSKERSREIALAMKLPQELDVSGSKLTAACQSLAQAVQQARYDLAWRFRIERHLAQLQVAANDEARIKQCDALLQTDVAAQQKLAQAATVWRERYQADLDAARSGIKSQWQPSSDAETEKRRSAALQPEPVKVTLTEAQCRKLPDWLGSDAANPDHEFNRNY
jgi:hypothetical protein